MLRGEEFFFTKIKEMLDEKYGKDKVLLSNEEISVPSRYPAVTFEESSNTTKTDTLTGDNVEHYVNVMYTVNVFSNKPQLAKRECIKILDDVDELLRSYGLTRTMNQQVDNYQRSISRRIARYRGVIGEDGFVYKSFWQYN